MSKKADKKQKAKVPEVDQDSPEWQDDVARKQAEAYDMIQRAIIRSQVRGQRRHISPTLLPVCLRGFIHKGSWYDCRRYSRTHLVCPQLWFVQWAAVPLYHRMR